MKKIYSLLITLAAGSMLSLSAQQLPNPGFEDGWGKTTCWTSNGTKEVDGLSPQGWTISHVAGYKIGTLWMGSTMVADKVNGYNSTSAPKIKNVTNQVAKSQYVPGYITLGTPWNTANTSGKNKDGGSFGGIEFTFRPDAIAFQYQREQASGSSEQATIVAYTWKGEITQKNVPGNIAVTATKVTMTDRDRCILGIETTYGDNPAEPSSDYEKVAYINQAITNKTVDSWTLCVVPFKYTSNAAPTKINVIFSAGDYFSTDPEVGNSLTIDDVKLLYYSRLASLSVNGTDVAGFDPDTYSYTVKGDMPDESGFAYTMLGNSGSGRASIALDQANNVATITVTNANAGGTDIDGQTSHVYTIKFEEPDEEIDITGGDIYKGTILIKGEEAGLGGDIERTGEVHIITAENGSITFALPDFALTDDAEGYIGDIVVNGLTVTEADGAKTYNGVVKGLALKMAGMDIVANVTVNGTVDADGKAVMTINVIWLQDPENDPEGNEYGLTIPVEFNGQMEKQDNPKPSYGGNVYDGTVTVQGEEAGLGGDIVRNGRVHIINNADGTTTFVLPDFALDDDPSAYIGDIVVNGLTMTEANGVKTYSGVVKGLALKLDGNDIVANVTVNGTVDATGNAVMQIDVVWLIDPENDPEGESGLKIPVLFNGQYNESMGIEDIPVDNSNAPVQWYNIRGMRVNGENLAPGIYIRRQGTQVEKILIR